MIDRLRKQVLDEDKVVINDTLNNEIWDKIVERRINGRTFYRLKEEIREALLRIGSAFSRVFDQEFVFEDLVLTGSMANFNYQDKSDVDLHLVVDFDSVGVRKEFLMDYFTAKKSLFNKFHNIFIYGHKVELYVEDKKAPAKSGGRFSITNNKWVTEPVRIEYEIDDVDDNPKYLELVNQVNQVLSSEYNYGEAYSLLDRIYKIRQTGLACEGEFSEGNLMFKKLRNEGLLDELKRYVDKSQDYSLSVKEN